MNCICRLLNLLCTPVWLILEGKSLSSYKVLPAYASESEAEECQVHHLKWYRGAFLWFFPGGPHVGCGQGVAWMADIRYIYIRYVFACIVL